MARVPDRYSRLIGWLKILLPLIALGILSTLFLVSRPTDPADTLPYSELDVRELAREERIGAPAYSGVTDDGTVVNVTAAVARPDPDEPGRLLAEDLQARFDAGALTTEVTAEAGTIDSATDSAVLTGDVRVESSTGYVLTSQRLDVGLGSGRIESPGALKAAGPLGDISAGAMQLDRGAGGEQRVVFNGGVRLTYDPSSASEGP